MVQRGAVLFLLLLGAAGGLPSGAVVAGPPAGEITEVPLPAEVLEPVVPSVVPPHGLSGWLGESAAADDDTAASPPAIETVAKPLEEFVRTPWNAPAFGAPTRPGLLVRQESRLPWGIDAELRFGVAVDSRGPGRGEFADASQWAIRKAIADDFVIYLHDRGSGFMKSFGQTLSVYGRYFATGDKSNPVSTVQFGAAKSY